jgi:hypothetical protein
MLRPFQSVYLIGYLHFNGGAVNSVLLHIGFAGIAGRAPAQRNEMSECRSGARMHLLANVAGESQAHGLPITYIAEKMCAKSTSTAGCYVVATLSTIYVILCANECHRACCLGYRSTGMKKSETTAF